MWSVEHTAHSSASPGAVWDVWADVAEWPRWNPTIQEVSLDAPFGEGTTGTMKPAKGPSSKLVLREVHPPASFVVVSGLPGARMRVEHEVAEAPEGGSRVTERAVLAGPLARLWALFLGRQLRNDMAAGTKATAREVDERSGAGQAPPD
jgi:uncharacterized protein YndB with AHSA1/START domain